MKHKTELKLIWKCLIVFAIAIGAISICFQIHSIRVAYVYEVRFLELDNTNVGIRENVVDYVCDEDVKVTNLQSFGQRWFYASTWSDADVHYGKCAIKVRIR